MTDISSSNNNTIINIIDWDELVLSNFLDNDHHPTTNETDDDCHPVREDTTTIIPMIQVDTECCVAVLPIMKNDNQMKQKKKMVVVEDVPMDFTYHITVLAYAVEISPPPPPPLDTTNSSNNRTPDDSMAATAVPISCSGVTMELYSTNVTTMESTIQSLFQWFRHGDHHNYHWNITIQAFSTQPRQVLPSLLCKLTNTTTMPTTPSQIRTLRICYCTITNTVWDWTEHDTQKRHWEMEAIEFVQCTIQCAWDTVLSLPLPTHTDTGTSSVTPPPPLELPQSSSMTSTPMTTLVDNQVPCRRAITLSCTLPEFIKFVEYLQQPPHSSSNVTQNITELHLKLHFFLPDQPVMINFSQAIATQCPSLTILSIQYLDLSDTGWNIFCKTLGNNATTCKLHSLSLNYTDNFVDTYRRLTVERCTKRTREMLDLVQAIPTLQDIHFPAYQQDTQIMSEIHAILDERKKIYQAQMEHDL